MSAATTTAAGSTNANDTSANDSSVVVAAAASPTKQKTTASKSGSNAHHQQRDALLKERQKIDAAMALLDAAKAKAAAQRAEYSKFLSWKVTMQRKERVQRDKEDAQLRQRVQDRLQTILEQHKSRKREELSK